MEEPARTPGRVQKVLLWLLGALFLAVLLFLLLDSWLRTTAIPYGEVSEYQSDNPFLHLPVLILVAVLAKPLCALLGKADLRALVALLAVWTAVAGTVVILSGGVSPTSDQFEVLGIARSFAAGNFAPAEYLVPRANNVGLVFYFTLCCTISGGADVLFIQFLNLAWLILIQVALVCITGRIFRDGAVTRLAVVLLMFCLQPVFYVTYVYGNLVALALSLLGLWCLLCWYDTGRLWQGLLAAGLVALASVLRGSQVIFLIALVVFCVYSAAARRSWRPLLCAGAAVALYFALNYGALGLYALLTGTALPRHAALVWVALGLHNGYNAPGWWDADYEAARIAVYGAPGHGYAEAAGLAMDDIGAALGRFVREPLYCLWFFYKKASSMWNNPTFQAFWVNTVQITKIEQSAFAQSLFLGGGADVLRGIMNIWQSVVLAGGVGMAALRLRKADARVLLLPLTLLGGFFFHLFFWEAKAQYALPYFMLLIPCAAAGFLDISRRLEPAWRALGGRLGRRLRGAREGRKNG